MTRFSDNDLLELVQRQTFRYFWDLAHPSCGLARDRIDMKRPWNPDAVVVGGSGFGVMAIVIATQRGWITRGEAVSRLNLITDFLLTAASFHGVFPHVLHGVNGTPIRFSRKDDGADLVETSYLIAGLLCARQFFKINDSNESILRTKINQLCADVEWSWFTREGRNVLYWHWSPNNDWAMNFEIRGWNECLITYVLAASSSTFGIDANVYHQGWAVGREFLNGRRYYDVELSLGPEYGGPLYFSQYSFLGLNPSALEDRYANYWKQNCSHTYINYLHCVTNKNTFKGYSRDCWGLTSSDGPDGYSDFSPTNDHGVIAPTAALSSVIYTPELSLAALRHYYYDLGDKIWSDCGFVDAFSEARDWFASSFLAIDQGPIIVMIENYRTGLIWNLFMGCDEVQKGLAILGFKGVSFTDRST